MVNCTVKNWQGEEVGETSLELKVAKEENASHLIHRAAMGKVVLLDRSASVTLA